MKVIVKKAVFMLLILSAIAGCSQNAGIINNPEILAQLEPVIKLSLMDSANLIPLKRSDLDALNRSVMLDSKASHHLEEMYWRPSILHIPLGLLRNTLRQAGKVSAPPMSCGTLPFA